MIDAVAIRTLADEIGRLFRPERIVLFGSYASGSPTADSDVDLLVVMPFVGVPAEQAAQIRSRIRPPFSLDLIVRSPERMAQRLAMGDPFLNEIAQHGKVLYEAAAGSVSTLGRLLRADLSGIPAQRRLAEPPAAVGATLLKKGAPQTPS